MSPAAVSCDEQLVAMDLSLPYRRDRNYIHSADIFQALTDLAHGRFTSKSYVTTLVLRRQATHQIRICFQSEPNAVGNFSICTGALHVSGWLVETDTEVRTRISYDESRALAAVIASPKAARFPGPVPGYTAFERLLVLLKVAGDLGQRDAWLCQVNLRTALIDSRPLTVNFQQRLHQFFAFQIVQNDRIIGSARASLRS